MLSDADAWAAIVTSNVSDGSSPEPLSAEELFSAYRLALPCLSRHSSPANRTLNCLASPQCFAGYHTLSTDPTALQECVAAILGPGPKLLPEVTTEKPTGKTLQIPRRGIRNLGNTCYLNAVLQMLFSVSGVRQEILKACDVERPLHHMTDGGSRVKTETGAADVRVGGALSESGLGELFAEMSLSRDVSGANTEPFASFLSLDPHTQQDAQEFFALLLNWLESEGGEAVHAAVRKAFEGTLLYDRVCTACGRSYKRAEPFFFLSVPVRSSLEDALGAFLQVEEVHGFVCEECGATTTASSMQYLRTLPEVLVIHLNRFTFDLNTLQRCKLTGTCSFPLEWDLSDLLRKWQWRNSAPAENTSDAELEALPYTLCGVVNHLGETAVSGHYTYYGKVDGRAGWYHFDDSEVAKLQRFNGARGNSKDAYMLIYQRSAKPCDSAQGDLTSELTSDGQIADTVVLPPRLLQHVRSMNNELERSYMHWGRQKADIMFFLQRWSEVAGDLFGKSPLPPHISNEEVIESLGDFLALPSSWLQLLGRGFMPSHIDVKRFGEKRKKRNRNASDPSVSQFSAPIKTDEGREDTDAGQDSFAGEAAAKAAAGDSETGDKEECLSWNPQNTSESEAAAAAAASGLGDGSDSMLAGIFSQVAAVEDHRATLLCPHGQLAPWAPFKLVPPAAAAKLATLMNVSSASHADGIPGVEWDDAALSKWRVRDNMCEACVRTMATEVLRLKQSLDEERAAQAMLRNEDGAPPSNAVYVSDTVLDYWEDLIAARSAWQEIVKRQGLTALHTVQQQCGYTQESLQVNGEAKAIPPLPSAGKLRCPHKLITPLTTARIVREELWHYLRDHVLLPACINDPNTSNSDALRRVEEILPLLPVARIHKCPDCIQSTVATTAERHRVRMAKMDEAKRFPTITAAGVHLTASVPLADAQTQHPNRALWKRNLERHLRDHRRVWEKSHAASVADQERRLVALEKKHAKERELEAQWQFMTTRRRGRRAQVHAQSDAGERRERDMEREVPVPLREAREALAAARVEQCPESRVAYGCVPTWWVTAWRRWCTASDNNIPTDNYHNCDDDDDDANNDNTNNNSKGDCSGMAPPCFDVDAFRCPHGGSLVSASQLNPVDPFWESRARAAHFTAFWRRRGRATAEDKCTEENAGCNARPFGTDNASKRSDRALHGNEAGLPPLVIVPMEEFMELAACYGRPGMFLSPDTGESGDATRVLDPSAVLLFVERNAERVMEPPTCQTCAAALLEAMEEASRLFTGGSLSLKLHLRKSKRQFYDASDVLTEVHHTTTLEELRLAISRLVLERHGFILPLEEMEILRGRKSLRSTRDQKQRPTCVWDVDASQKSTQEEGEVAKNKKEEEEREDEAYCTLAECGVCDGDLLTVNAIDRVLTATDRDAEPEVWQDIPPELLDAKETAHAFGATRLYGAGAGGKSKATDASTTAKAEVACDVCTFLNSATLSYCEMCESPLRPPLS